MSKKTAVVAVDPVNGSGLFQYLEAFYENGIPFEVFAAAETKNITTNSGIPLTVHGTVSQLKDRSGQFDALVFACGDAVPKFRENADKPYNLDLMKVLREFAERGKIIAGHCAAGLMFEIADIDRGIRLAVHPLAVPAIRQGIATDLTAVSDRNFHTAQDENQIRLLLPDLIEALK